VFCARCGQQIQDTSEICPLCGREATLSNISPTSVPIQGAIPAARQLNASPSPNLGPISPLLPKPKEVGGWLMFFCILLTVISPLVVLVMAWSGDLGVEFLFNIGWAAFGALVGFMIWNVQQQAFLLLWIYFGITALLIGFAVVNLLSAEQGVPIHDSILMFRSAIYCVAWFLYFKRSERVKKTFGRNL
jgi:hypothetical protein